MDDEPGEAAEQPFACENGKALPSGGAKFKLPALLTDTQVLLFFAVALRVS